MNKWYILTGIVIMAGSIAFSVDTGAISNGAENTCHR
jgi:hypothetical protein